MPAPICMSTMAAGSVCPCAVCAVHENAGALDGSPSKGHSEQVSGYSCSCYIVYIYLFFVLLGSVYLSSCSVIVYWFFLYTELSIDVCM